ncbi:MAG: 50S ribosomal protein L11 methyltransferase [Oscillospiraceae bacterium]|nr:50S ribosomal protein L11 methyltransferase [Candidatus Limimonas coprohippi]
MEDNNAYINFGPDADWTEIVIEINADDLDRASDIANMAVPYGIYIEDYRTLMEEAWDIAHIDLIDEELLEKDKNKGIIHVYLEPGTNPSEAIAFLRERFGAEGINHTINTILCKNEDWQNKWKENYKPIEIGEKLAICPDWISDYDPKNRKVLNLEPGLAFGTGTHNTTRLCLETLEEKIKGGESVLDLGCGSGILALSSLLLGAETAVGVDIDELATKTAIENGKANNFTAPKYQIFCGDMTEQIKGQFDIVVANIVADIIILFCQNAKNFMKPNGIFIVSGIIDNRENDVLAAFEKYGFNILERHQSENWLCFVLN